MAPWSTSRWSSGAKLGTIQEIYLDEETNQPATMAINAETHGPGRMITGRGPATRTTRGGSKDKPSGELADV